MTRAENRLRQDLEALVRHHDSIAEKVDRLEGVLIEEFYEDERFNDLLEAASRFRPSGGEFLYSDEDILKLARSAIEKLDSD